MKKSTGLLVAALLFVTTLVCAGTASAKSTRYDCRFSLGQAGPNSAIPDQMLIEYVEGSDTAIVSDPNILYFAKAPIKAELTADTKARREFHWKLYMWNREGKDTNMSYTFVFYKDGRPAKVVARPGGYDNSFSGGGTCKATQR